ncbi:hypothetical protein BZA70DRAFT_291166 [Myxozyma melibiosi]|uniref:Uncharacterized protein n=1 Tax=Myxozyma melibiosi TaxID=54550 RepID=A0ABR1F1B3_9ASCO
MAYGKKKTRSSRASQHAAAISKHDPRRPHPTHSHSLISSQGTSTAERGNGRLQPCDRDPQPDIDSQWREYMNDYLDGILFSACYTDAQKFDAIRFAYDNFVSRTDKSKQ